MRPAGIALGRGEARQGLESPDACGFLRGRTGMPELPEVETVRRGLEPAMVGARFDKVEQRRPDLRFRFPKRFVARLTGQEVVGLGRRAKYLLADLSSGEVLVMHLGMSGRFLVTQGGRTRVPGEFHAEAGGESAHDHV